MRKEDRNKEIVEREQQREKERERSLVGGTCIGHASTLNAAFKKSYKAEHFSFCYSCKKNLN